MNRPPRVPRGRVSRAARSLVASTVLAWAPFAGAQEDETYAERHVFDPDKKWVETAAPIAGTEDGDLELARSWLARGEHKSARKAFKSWLETYGDSPRRPEALFYAADAEVSAEQAKRGSGDVMRAYRWYEELLEGWPGSELADRALRRELIVAQMFLSGTKQRVWKGMLRLPAREEGLMILDRIIDTWAPGTPIAEQCLRTKADHHYERAEYEDAEQAFARLVRDFPRSRYHRFAMLRSGESALAQFPGVQFDDADLLEAQVYLRDVQDRYPEYAADHGVPQRLARIEDSRAEKEYRVGEYYERTKKTGAAVFYYRLVVRKWPDSTWAALSQNKLAAVGASESSSPAPTDSILDEPTPAGADTVDSPPAPDDRAAEPAAAPPASDQPGGGH